MPKKIKTKTLTPKIKKAKTQWLKSFFVSFSGQIINNFTGIFS